MTDPHHLLPEPQRTPTAEWDDAQIIAALLHGDEAAFAMLVKRLVLTLRDVEGFSALEVCSILDVSETNQRIQLDRARSRVRAALEQIFNDM